MNIQLTARAVPTPPRHALPLRAQLHMTFGNR